MSNFRPTSDDVGALMRARTKVRGGVELGIFRDEGGPSTPGTRPSATEVEATIDRVFPTVAATLGEVPEALVEVARTAVVYKVAQVLEVQYWPEQNDGDQSAAANYALLYSELVGTDENPGPLLKRVEGDTPGKTASYFSVPTIGRDGTTADA